MNSNETLIIKGMVQELKEQEKKICAKIEGASELIRSHCSTLLHDSYDQMARRGFDSIGPKLRVRE